MHHSIENHLNTKLVEQHVHLQPKMTIDSFEKNLNLNILPLLNRLRLISFYISYSF